ncbi:MAG: DAK2 domain-containing protein [Actinomycetota bacterium]
MTRRLRSKDLERLMRSYLEALRAFQEEINALNVYPVPDGDTGTNLVLTMEAVVESIDAGGNPDMAALAKAVTRGSLMGARGNSGVILSQVFRGLCEVLGTKEEHGAADVARALRRASELAYGAVQHPVEGTILTVVREASEVADPLPGDGDLEGLLVRATQEARASLDRTPDLLPALKQAGVVDAGALGYVVFLETFLAVVTGGRLPSPEVRGAAAAIEVPERRGSVGPRETGSPEFGFEVQYVLETQDEKVPRLRERLAKLGDSLAVVGGGGRYNVHVHTNEVGQAIEAGMALGRSSRVQVTFFADQVAANGKTGAGPVVELPDGQTMKVATAVVAVASGEGVAGLLRSRGAHCVVAGGQSMNPSTADILAGIEAAPSQDVVVLPNNPNIIPVARKAAEVSSKRVRVVPTHAVGQAVCALAGFQPSLGIEVAAALLEAAAAAVRDGAVTRAVRDALTPQGPVKAGQWMGLSGGEVAVVAEDGSEALLGLVARLLEVGGRKVVLLAGEDAPAAEAEALLDRLRGHFPDVAFELYQGGQPLYPYLLGVE